MLGVLFWDDFSPPDEYYYYPPGIVIHPRIFPYMQIGLPTDLQGHLGFYVRLNDAVLVEQGELMPGIMTSLPALQFQGQGLDETLGDLSFSKPPFIFSATGEMNQIGTLNISLPALLDEIIGLAGVTGQLVATRPRFKLDGVGLVNPQGTLSVSMPKRTMSQTGLIGLTGTLSLTLPSLKGLLSSLSSIEGQIAITLPLLLASLRDLPATYLNMVMNLRNYALTEFTNYNFNSMCRFNGKHLAADKTGIHDLDLGSADDGDYIDWNFRTGYLDLHQKVKKRLKQAWLSYKSDGDLIVSACLPDGTIYEYEVDGVEIVENGMRVKFGKGIRSKYVALDVKNVDGSSIELDTIKLHFDKTAKVR